MGIFLCIITLPHQDESLTDAHAHPGGDAKSPQAAYHWSPNGSVCVTPSYDMYPPPHMTWSPSGSVCVTPSTPPTPDVPPEEGVGVGGKQGTGGTGEGGVWRGLSTPPTPHAPPSSQTSAAGRGGGGGGGGAVEEGAGRGGKEGAGGCRVLLQEGGLRQVENALDIEQERLGKGKGTHGEGGDTHGESGGMARAGLLASMNEWLHTLAKKLKRTAYSDFIQ